MNEATFKLKDRNLKDQVAGSERRNPATKSFCSKMLTSAGDRRSHARYESVFHLSAELNILMDVN
jgi:hypothetical protein